MAPATTGDATLVPDRERHPPLEMTATFEATAAVFLFPDEIANPPVCGVC